MAWLLVSVTKAYKFQVFAIGNTTMVIMQTLGVRERKTP
jgi:hypothetical protein